MREEGSPAFPSGLRSSTWIREVPEPWVLPPGGGRRAWVHTAAPLRQCVDEAAQAADVGGTQTRLPQGEPLIPSSDLAGGGSHDPAPAFCRPVMRSRIRGAAVGSAAGKEVCTSIGGVRLVSVGSARAGLVDWLRKGRASLMIPGQFWRTWAGSTRMPASWNRSKAASDTAACQEWAEEPTWRRSHSRRGRSSGRVSLGLGAGWTTSSTG